MAINKVTKDGQAIIDLSNDTVLSAGDIVSGKVGHLQDGTQATGTAPTGVQRSSSDVTASGQTVTVPAGVYSSQVQKSVASGTAGTPTATKGSVSNHSVTVTPKVTNTTGYITGGTKTGSAVTVSASELVSGSETKTENGTYDVTNLASLVVNVSGGGGGGAGIYGAEWAGTSDPSWTRTDDAANFSDPVPYVAGATNYGSPFDNIMPWAGMQIVEDAEAGTLVSVPKFWYKLSGGGGSPLKIQIANHAEGGFSVSPMHMDRGDGKGERGIAFIGRYHCDTDYKSTTGVKPKVSITRSTARSGIHALGNNVWQGDFAMRFTIWLLYLVEYADWGSQWVIGAGCGDGTSPMDGVKAMGYTDSMPYHTGTNLSSKRTFGYGTQYRYIEGLWDNVYDWLDGCYYNSNGLNLIKNPSSFSDSSGGTLAGLPVSGIPKVMSVSTNGGYPIFYPTTTGGSYESSSGGSITAEGSYVPDYWGFLSSNPCLYAGSSFYGDAYCGLFCVYSGWSTYADGGLGCRLQKLP